MQQVSNITFLVFLIANLSKNGNLLYRHDKVNCLGATGMEGCEGTELVKWYITNAPLQWLQAEDAEAWICDRGFKRVESVTRAGYKRWTFFGDTPPDVTNTVFTFQSGILVSKCPGYLPQCMRCHPEKRAALPPQREAPP